MGRRTQGQEAQLEAKSTLEPVIIALYHAPLVCLSPCCRPSILHLFTSHNNIGNGCYYYPNVADEETEAQ